MKISDLRQTRRSNLLETISNYIHNASREDLIKLRSLAALDPRILESAYNSVDQNAINENLLDNLLNLGISKIKSSIAPSSDKEIAKKIKNPARARKIIELIKLAGKTTTELSDEWWNEFFENFGVKNDKIREEIKRLSLLDSQRQTFIKIVTDRSGGGYRRRRRRRGLFDYDDDDGRRRRRRRKRGLFDYDDDDDDDDDYYTESLENARKLQFLLESTSRSNVNSAIELINKRYGTKIGLINEADIKSMLKNIRTMLSSPELFSEIVGKRETANNNLRAARVAATLVIKYIDDPSSITPRNSSEPSPSKKSDDGARAKEHMKKVLLHIRTAFNEPDKWFNSKESGLLMTIITDTISHFQKNKFDDSIKEPVEDAVNVLLFASKIIPYLENQMKTNKFTYAQLLRADPTIKPNILTFMGNVNKSIRDFS